MRTLDKYLLRESIVPLLIGTFAVVLMLLGGILYDNARVFFGSRVPIAAVFQLLLYRVPYLLVLTLPAGTVVAVSLVVSRLTRDSEIAVMRTSGLPLIRILAPLLAGATLISLFDFGLQELAMPSAQKAYSRLFYRILSIQPEPYIRPNVIFQVNNYAFTVGVARRAGNQVLLKDVAVFDKSMPGSVNVIYAKSGLYDAGKWTLTDVQVYHLDSEGNVVSARTKKEVTLNLRTEFAELSLPPMAEAMPVRDLAKRIDEKRRQKLDTHEDEVNLHAKFAVPAACLFLAFISPMLALAFARGGSFVGVLLSIVLVFVYWNTLLLFVKILGVNGLLPPALAAWAPNIIFGVVGLALLKRAE